MSNVSVDMAGTIRMTVIKQIDVFIIVAAQNLYSDTWSGGDKIKIISVFISVYMYIKY